MNRRKKTDPTTAEAAAPPVVAIGASAGGYEALQAFFEAMPPQSGLAFVVVPHLDTHHPSALVELLGRRTRMPVVEIAERMALAPDRIHVIPPDSTLQVTGRVLHVERPRREAHTIDAFLRSLAAAHGERAIAIILSGSGNDGSAGIRFIKEHGGLAIAQAPDSARHDGMPRSAIATGQVDVVLPVEQMPARLIEYARHLATLTSAGAPQTLRQQTQRLLPKICTVLKSRTGHDFGHYKESTLIRRIQRRMQVTQAATVADYLDVLRREPGEAEALFRDLLIGVTHFFRDPKAFEALSTAAIAPLLDAKGPEGSVRIWVPGCATGEEAYSVAILLREHMRTRDVSLRVQIFATDIDDHALATARLASYPDSIAADVSAERLERFFVREGSMLRVVKEIREMCVFSVHDVIKDPPFSRIDLICCRNLLIYFDGGLQSRVLSLFHFALQQNGFLFLGPSENVTSQPRLFAPVEARHRIFRARVVKTKAAPDFPLASVGFRQQPETSRRVALAPAGREAVSRRAQRIIDGYAPASVVVDEHHDILHFSGRTGRYLQPTPGAASLNLFSIAEPSLRPALRSVIREAAASGGRAVHENIAVPVNGGVQLIDLIAETLPAAEGEPQLCVIVFQEQGGQRKPGEAGPASTPEGQKDAIIQQLEAELLAIRERLQATVEELETQNEEMKSSNEELETSKEELQSINEELETVNAELSAKVESLDRANSDRKNLLESTQVAAMFLDSQLRIKSFTPAVTEIFRLIDSDAGRPITDIAMNIGYGDLRRDVERVLRALAPVEHEVSLAARDATYIMRILPYRTIDNVIDGVVVTFIDITERKRNEQSLGRLAAIVAGSIDAIYGLTLEGTISSWNAGAERLYGYTAAEALGKPVTLLVRAEESEELRGLLRRVAQGEAVSVESERITRAGQHVPVWLAASPILDSAGRTIAISMVDRDITERKRHEEHQTMLLAELNHRVKNTLATVISIAQRTLHSSTSLPEFRDAFHGRVLALARAHELLAQHAWDAVGLHELAAVALQPYGASETVRTAGGAVAVAARAAPVLAMLFHELATNASKHGSLSQPSGRVELTWRTAGLDGADHLLVDWRERGGPPLAGAPDAKHYGLTFVERAIQHELGGKAVVSFEPEGLHCELWVPLAALAAGTASPPDR